MKVQELLKEPESWTRGALARGPRGEAVSSKDPMAVQWCLIGALMRCHDDTKITDTAWDRLNDEVRLRYGTGAAAWNDAEGRTHAEVLALVKELDI